MRHGLRHRGGRGPSHCRGDTASLWKPDARRRRLLHRTVFYNHDASATTPCGTHITRGRSTVADRRCERGSYPILKGEQNLRREVTELIHAALHHESGNFDFRAGSRSARSNVAVLCPASFYGGAATPPTDLSSGIGNYCIYENLIYSIGSPLCIGKTSYICAPSTDKVGFNQRGYWTNRPADPNLLVEPACR